MSELPRGLEDEIGTEMSGEEVQVCTSDPASFLVACAVTTRLRDSVSELKRILSAEKAELEMVVDKVIANMARVGLIRVFGDKFFLTKSNPYMALWKTSSDLIPKIAGQLAKHILNGSREGGLRAGEALRWYYLPEHPEVIRRMNRIHRAYVAEMDALQVWAEGNEELAADKIRMSVLMTGNLNPEDF